MANMAALGCTTADLYDLNKDLPVYPMTKHQAMPRQETG
jgi:hypothetical protein